MCCELLGDESRLGAQLRTVGHVLPVATAAAAKRGRPAAPARRAVQPLDNLPAAKAAFAFHQPHAHGFACRPKGTKTTMPSWRPIASPVGASPLSANVTISARSLALSAPSEP